MLEQKWRIVLLNGLALHQGSQSTYRFRTQKTGELLAYLALNLPRTLTREELAEKIWPESDPEAGRASLRTALVALRHQLEPPGTPANSVLCTDRTTVRLQTEAVTTDVEAFEAASRREAEAPPEAQLPAGLEALRLYTGELLPGCYADWVFPERERLSQAYLHLLRSVISGLWKSGDKEQALEHARRLIAADPLREEAHLLIMRLYAAAGRPTDALRCFQNWKRLLQEEMNESPSPAMLALAQKIGEAIGKAEVPSAAHARNIPEKEEPPLLLPSDIPTAASPAPRERTHAAMEEAPPTVRLPLTLTRFFGRETEIGEILQMLFPATDRFAVPQMQQRLVILTGPGGAGKTRLAVEVARRLAEQAAYSVTFVPLAEIRKPQQIAEAIARALTLPSMPPERLLPAITTALCERPHLLILDNFEQLLTHPPMETDGESESQESAAWIVHNLLASSPTLSCLVTSRQCLEIEGEQEYPLQPLMTPAHPGTPERLLEFACVQLFVDRARAARPDFQLTPRNAGVVGALCARLEGLPLALELAAAWSSILSPAQIQERLSQRFELLISRRKGRLARHQTLWAAIEWSYQLLSPDLQTFFARLSVFRGGWTVEAAEAVCEREIPHGGRRSRGHALEDLQALRDRSLVTVEESEGEETEVLRFGLLESLREFAAEQLPEAERIALCRAHLQWVIAVAAKAETQLSGANEALWLQRLDQERENIRAALQWSLEDPEGGQQGLRLLGMLSQYWYVRGNYAEVRSLLERSLDRPDAQEPTPWRAAALMTAGNIAGLQGDAPTAVRYQQESLQIVRQLEDPLRLAVTLFNLGNAMVGLNDLEAARKYYEESLIHYERVGQALGLAYVNGALAYLAGRADDLPTAIAYDLRALEILRKLNQTSSIAHYARHLAIVSIQAGQFAQAHACLCESLDGYEKLKDVRSLAQFLRNLVHLLPIAEASVRLMAAAQALHATTADAPIGFDGDLERGRAALGDTAFEAAWADGTTLTFDQAVGEARALLAQHREFIPPGSLRR